MVKMTAVILILLIAFPLTSMAQQKEGITPEMALKAAGLFPEVTGSCTLHEIVTMRLDQSGVRIVNYSVNIGGKKAGEVSRIMSLLEEGLAADIDLLVRYDDKGMVNGIVPLKQWKEGPGSYDISFFLSSLKGKDLRDRQASLVAMLNSISAGAALSDGMAPPAPEGGYPLTVRQLLLEPGTKLPSLKIKDLAGKELNAATFKDKLLIAFVSPESVRSRDMVLALEALTAQALKEKKVSLVYIISSPVEKAVEYANGLDLKGIAAADPAGIMGRMFMAPYTPYLFMFDKGVLSAQTKWEGEEPLQKHFRQFLERRNAVTARKTK